MVRLVILEGSGVPTLGLSIIIMIASNSRACKEGKKRVHINWEYGRVSGEVEKNVD